RYRQPLQNCVVSSANKQSHHPLPLLIKEGIGEVLIFVDFSSPQRAITPGQSAVFYTKNGEMLGGGIIE
ncbi:MAG: aminomethyltransferase beta-barrel domain-containing protein, partial [Patescibacteria group bacterium]